MDLLGWSGVGAGSLAVIWLTLLSFIAVHQGGTIRQLRASDEVQARVLADISRRLDKLVDENDMRRIIREELPTRRPPRASAVSIKTQSVEAVAGHDIGLMADRRSREERIRDD